MFHASIAGQRQTYTTLAALLAAATPARSGDRLAGIAAPDARTRVAAQAALADLPLATILEHPVIPYESDDVTRLIVDGHDTAAFAPIRHLTVGGLRDYLLADTTAGDTLAALAPGLTPEIVAAVSKICRVQDLILIARKVRVVTAFRTTIGLPGRLSTRLQPNHPSDDPAGIAASVLDGLLLGAGDACIGINPASDSPERTHTLLCLLDDIRQRLDIPTQSCVLAHVTTTLELMRRGSPVDLVFQSIAGTQAANASFGITLAMLDEAADAARQLNRGTVGRNAMYFETGQGSALSANAHGGVDQQTLEARAYAVARRYDPLLVNTVVGFIGPEYLFDGKQITRAGLEDHFCGKLLGLPMGCDVCYTNHAEADEDDSDALLALLVSAGLNFVMGVPGADDVMLGYQSTSFHDALAMREIFGKRPAPEFEAWLARQGLLDQAGRIRPPEAPALLRLMPPASAAGPVPARADALRGATPARIFLPRSGASPATPPLLAFRLAQAEARDAVHAPFDVPSDAPPDGKIEALRVRSAAADRRDYLMRPDHGRQLDGTSARALAEHAGDFDLAIVLADGLSPGALARFGPPLLAALLPKLDGWSLAPTVIAEHARVALGDAVAGALGARAVLILIGERPGLSTPESLGAYLTWAPSPTTTDADRNCVSNIQPTGLGAEAAAGTIAFLLRGARAAGRSGVALKDESGPALTHQPT